jgi:hypothetical protein
VASKAKGAKVVEVVVPRKVNKPKKARKKVEIVEVDTSRPMSQAAVQQQRAAIREKGLSTTGVGATIGNLIYPGLGGMLGNAAEGLFKTILGKGDYKEVENISEPLPTNNTVMGLQTPRVAEQVMQMHSSGIATRVQHREYFGSISMSSGYVCGAYPLNPTIPFFFPWLSTIASSWQKWKLLGCVIEYVPTSTNAISAGTPAVGQVAMCVDYDFYAPAPDSLTNLLNTQGAVSGRPQDQIVCAVECDSDYTPMNPLFVTAQVGAADTRFEAFGRIMIATQGPAAYSNAGQMWITYDIMLISPWIFNITSSVTEKPVITRDEGKDDKTTGPTYEVVPGALGGIGRAGPMVRRNQP